MSETTAPSLASKWQASGLPDASYSDVVLTFGVVAIIALMIWPLPLWLIDTLVAVNISIGIGLLLVAIYIPSPVAFPSFPSVLLLSTLFRLSLSIAVTRQILLQADGGHIIETFGNVVAGGNIVVGLVVFLIITVVQFIVVAKGAERVAEVAARFTLDAMPGKQLSIDSDLRSGLMGKEDAKKKRRHLEIESQLHGSLDGAMKFVKGDAIAGIIIIIVNLLGGLGIGILQNGMSLGDAVHTYSILTIGDGLVAQIPALLSAISAGLVVTRTANDSRDKHLGDAIARQISAQPRVLLITGIIAFGMAFVPGFPMLVFLVLSAMLLAISGWRMRDQLGFVGKALHLPPMPDETADDADDMTIGLPAPLLLSVSQDIADNFDLSSLDAMLRGVVAELRDEYGVPLPAPAVRVGSALEDFGYQLHSHGVRIAAGRLRVGQEFALESDLSSEQAAGGIDPDIETEPRYQPQVVGRWVPAGEVEKAYECSAFLRSHCLAALRRQLPDFIGIQEASRVYQHLSADYPDLVKEALRAVAPQRITEVLKRLVGEDIPIRDLRGVFEALADAGVREKDILQLTEQVRISMRRQVSDRFADDDRTLAAILVQPELEDRLRQSVRVTNGTSQLAVDPELAGTVMTTIRSCLADNKSPARAVLLCSQDVRRHLRMLIEAEFFELPVISFQELVPDLRVVPLGQLAA